MRKFFGLFLVVTTCLQASASADFLKGRVCEIVPSIEGFCSVEKAENFIDLVLETEPNLCVEIGVFGGASLFPVAAALKFIGKGVVVGIDPWDSGEAIKCFHPIRDKIEFSWWKNVDFHRLFDSYCSLINRYKLMDYCITMKATSERAAICFQDIDILHIDGNLSEIVTTQDVMQYLPLVRPGGYIWISDADKHRKQKASAFLSKTCDLIKTIDKGGCLLFKKRDPS